MTENANQLPWNHVLYSVRWFHGDLSGEEADKLFREVPENDGAVFLVRRSQINRDEYVISYRSEGQTRNVRVERSEEGFYSLGGGDEFASLTDLVDHYMKCTDKIFPDTLKHAIHCTEPINERWYHGGITAVETERLLKQTTCQPGSYLVRRSSSKPGTYALSVRTNSTDKTVTHLLINSQRGRYDVGKQSFPSLSELLDHYKKTNLFDKTGQAIPLTQPYNGTRFNVSKVKQRINELELSSTEHRDGKNGFWREYEHLQSMGFFEKAGSKVESEIEANKTKNRFKNILPYDHSRVVLKKDRTEPLESGQNYINANHVRAMCDDVTNGSQKAYIATQGCLNNTVADFWHMVWQERCQVIVMTTKLVERGKSKCARYWPDQNENELSLNTADGGRVVVRRLEEKPFPDYIERKFMLVKYNADQSEKEEIPVYQFHFTSWPDKQVPQDADAVVKFIIAINKRHEELHSLGPVTVHCSAGIGRTGTLIVLSVLIQQIKEQGPFCEVDIQNTVAKIRGDRSGMVQTEAQYKFVYQAVKYYVNMMSGYGYGKIKVEEQLYENVNLKPQPAKRVEKKPLPGPPPAKKP